MAKRILLFVVLCFVSVSFSWGQCDKNFMLYLNNNTVFHDGYTFGNDAILVCKDNKNVFRFEKIEGNNLTFKWYRNDTLVNTTQSAMFETSREGSYQVEVTGNGCNFKIGPFVLKATHGVDIRISDEEITICENVQSPSLIWGSTNLSSAGKTYQWQKNGKDIQDETTNYIYPSSSGVYTLRITAGNCSATSPPVTVKASPDNKLSDYIYNINGIRRALVDSVFLCKDNSYLFAAGNGETNWYRNGQFLVKDDYISIDQSGTYHISREITPNCILESKPLYVSLGKIIKPIKLIDSVYNQISCGYTYAHFNDPNLTGTNKLQFHNPANGSVFSFANLNNYYVLLIEAGKYNVDFETGSCKSPTSVVDIKAKVPVMAEGGKVIKKKVALCPNSSFRMFVDNFDNDEVILYRNDTAIQTKPSGAANILFTVAQTGKYYFKIIQANCNPAKTFVSDTVEIDIEAPVSTTLQLMTENCATGKYQISAKEYQGYTYNWYKNGQLVPDQNSANLAITANDFGNYYATIQKDLCAVTTQKIEVGEKIKGPSTVCQNTRVNLSSSITQASYLWKGPDNFNSTQATISIDSADTKHEGWYILKTLKNGCTFTDSIQIKVPTRPNLSVSFLNPMCVNKDVLVDLKGPEGMYTLRFLFQGAPIVGIGLYLSSNQGNEGTYRTSLGTLSSFSANGQKEFLSLEKDGCSFLVAIPPRLSEEACQDMLDFVGIKTNYCAKENASFEIKIPQSIPEGTKFNLWIESWGSKYKIGTFSGNKIVAQIPENTYSYFGYFVLESEDGKYKIFSKQVTINYVRPTIFYHNGSYETQNPTHCKGFAIKLKSYNATYQQLQWRKDGVAIPRATADTLEVVEDGVYTLVASYNGCTEESSPVRLTSADIPRPYIYSLLGDKRACEGFGVPLRDDQNFAYTAYEWKHNGKVIETRQKNGIFDAKKTGYYSLTARQGSCVATSDSVFIEIGQRINNSIYGYGEGLQEVNKITLCDGLSFSLSADYYSTQRENFFQQYGLSFQWRLNDKNIPEATTPFYNSKQTGKYRLQIKQGDCITNSNEIEVVNLNPTKIKLISNYYDYTGNYYQKDKPLDTIAICSGDSLHMSPPYNNGFYSWNKELYKDGKLISARTIETKDNWNSSYSLKESGKYSVRLYHPKVQECFVLSDTMTLQVSDKPIIWPVDSIYSCNEVTGMYMPVLGQKYEWFYDNKIISTDPYIETNRLGMHTLKIQKTDACYVEKGYFVERKLKPVLNRYNPESWSSVICPTDKFSLELTNQSNDEFGYGAGYEVEWYRDKQKLPYIMNYIEVNEAGNYFAKVKYKECEATSNVIKLDVVQIKNPITPIIDSLGICVNGGFRILQAPKEIGYTYEWFKDNVGLTENTSSIKATQAGVYKALIQYDNCSVLTPQVKIYPSNELPKAIISGDTTLNFGETANLKISFTSSPPFTYKLNNNEEGTAEMYTVTHPVKIQESTIFKLTSIKNACGDGTVSGEAKINVIILGNEPLIGHKITIAPVPAESYCEIIIDLTVPQEVSYQLLDMNGRQLSEKNLGQVTYKKQYLNLNHLAAGEYLIRMQVGKDFETRKLIKF